MDERIDELRYRAFLVRLWQEANELAWHCSLQDAHSHAQRSFNTLTELIEFLQAQVETTAADSNR